MNRVDETGLESLNLPQGADTDTLEDSDLDRLRLIFSALPGRGLDESVMRGALKDFQRTRGLEPHGRVDAETRKELERAASWVVHERQSLGELENAPDFGRWNRAPSGGPRGTEMDIAAQAMQARIEDATRPRLASRSLVDEMRSASDAKWNTTLAERREQIEQVRHDIFQHGARAYQRLTPEARHQLWVGVLLTGSAEEGARIGQMLRSQSPALAREALDDLYVAGLAVHRNTSAAIVRRPSDAQLAETLRTVLDGVPREAWEVELEATWQGDPPPHRASASDRQLMQHVLLRAMRDAATLMREHPRAERTEAFYTALESMAPESLPEEAAKSLAGEALGEAFAGVGDVLAVLQAAHEGGVAAHRGQSWENAFAGAMEDEVWRLAEEEPLPGTEHWPVDRRAAAIRSAVMGAIESERARAEWMSRHPEHPANG